jgi:Cu2+-exporting ATPase
LNSSEYNQFRANQESGTGIGYDLLLEDENKQQETLEAIHAEKFKKKQPFGQ